MARGAVSPSFKVCHSFTNFSRADAGTETPFTFTHSPGHPKKMMAAYVPCWEDWCFRKCGNCKWQHQSLFWHCQSVRFNPKIANLGHLPLRNQWTAWWLISQCRLANWGLPQQSDSLTLKWTPPIQILTNRGRLIKGWLALARLWHIFLGKLSCYSSFLLGIRIRIGPFCTLFWFQPPTPQKRNPSGPLFHLGMTTKTLETTNHSYS